MIDSYKTVGENTYEMIKKDMDWVGGGWWRCGTTG